MLKRWFFIILLPLFPGFLILLSVPLLELFFLGFGAAGACGIGFLILRTTDFHSRFSLTETAAASFLLGIPGVALSVSLLQYSGLTSPLIWMLPTAIAAVLSVYRFDSLKRFFRSAARRESAALWVLLALAVCMIGMPYLNIGKETVSGNAYRAYFDHDFLVHLSVVTELAHGHMPPRNPYFAGESLHYYWLVFQFAAGCYRLGPPHLDAERILIGMNLLIALSFTILVFLVVRMLSGSRPAAAFTGFAVMFCGSYEGFYWLVTRCRAGLNPWDFRHQNIDGLTRWIIGPPQIDTLFRGLLFTPQHLTALALFLIAAVHLISETGGIRKHVQPILAFIYLVVTGCSMFIGVIFFAWLGCVEIAVAVRRREIPWMRWTETIGIIGVSFCIWTKLEMLAVNRGSLVWGSHDISPVDMGRIFLLNFGLLPFMALAGVFLNRNRQFPAAAGSLLLMVISLGVIFGMVIQDYENEFGLRGGFIFFLACAGGIGLLFSRFSGNRKAVMAVLAVFCLPGLTSVVTDAYNMQDIYNGRFTLYLDASHQDLLRSIRREAFPEEMFQGDPERFSPERNGILPNLIPPFAERCMHAGRTYYGGQFQIGKAAAARRVKTIQNHLASPHLLDLFEYSIRENIGGWLIGRYEIGRYPAGTSKFDRPRFFKTRFKAGSYTVYRADRSNLPGVLQYLLDGKPVESLIDWDKTMPARTEPLPSGSVYSAVTSISGLEDRPIRHDWIFSPAALLPGTCHVSVRNPVIIEQGIPDGSVSVDLDMYYIDCRNALNQSVALWIEDQIIGTADILPGWHRYRFELPLDLPRRTALIWTLVSRRFIPPEEICAGSTDTRIGRTGVQSPKPILVRSGPAAGTGFYGDVFYDGINLSPHGPGYNLVRIPPVEPPAVFDMVTDPVANTRMADWIENLPRGQIICGVALAGAEKCIDSIGWKSLSALGLHLDPRLSGAGHAFIGVRGADPGTALEVIPDGGVDFVYAGPHQGDEPFGFALRNLSFR
ncbi:hypothetical protein JXA40_11365 [bacterium]|nr:hypothetical protein [candidate division CSSED10-310 bacterium]